MHTASSMRNDAPRLDVIETAVAANHFSMLCNAFRAAALTDAMKGAGPFTVFAPTDAAFRKLPRDTMNALLKDKPKLAGILTYHVIAARLMAKDLRTTDLVSMNGQNLRTVVDDDGMRINNARIMKTDIEASNGVIHSIDTVLMPD